MSFRSHNLKCPECWIDPEILPLVQLLNEMGFETVWSCAGTGEARDMALHAELLKENALETGWSLEREGQDCYLKSFHDPMAMPYVTFKTPPYLPDPMKDALDTLKLKHYTPPSFLNQMPLYRILVRRDNQQSIHVADELTASLNILSEDPDVDWKIAADNIREAWTLGLMRIFTSIRTKLITSERS